jgi:hypothetical protein
LAALLTDAQPEVALAPDMACNALEAVCAALRRHVRRSPNNDDDASAAEAGCHAVTCLWPDAHTRARRGVTAAAVVVAMDAHPRDAAVAAAGCLSLQTLLLSSSSSRRAEAAGNDGGDVRYDGMAVARALHAALRAHPRAADVKLCGEAALSALSAAVHAAPNEYRHDALQPRSMTADAHGVTAAEAALRARFPELAAQHDAASLAAETGAEEQLRCSHTGCGAAGAADGVALKRCAACGVARYCSKACQVADWAAHKKACRAARRAAGDDA